MMRRFFALLLCLCMLVGLIPAVYAQKEPIEQENITAFTQEEYAPLEELWAQIDALKTQLKEAAASDEEIAAAVAELVMQSDVYEENSICYEQDHFSWRTTEGVVCRYSYHEVEEDRGISEGEPIIPPESGYEFISYAKRGASSGKDVYLIGPFYGVESNFTTHYQTVAKKVAAATGGTYTMYAYKEATIDAVANAISAGSIVMVDSHGTYATTNGKTRSFLRLKSGEGITQSDYNNGYAYAENGMYMVTGEAIAAHMKTDAPNSFVWYGICSGMRYNTMYNPILQRGVEACFGYSRTVSFAYDRNWLSALCDALISGKNLAQSSSSMKSSVGKWDHYNESATDTLSEARSAGVAFPIVVSDEDSYPSDLQQVQTVASSWKLAKCSHTSAQFIEAVDATCTAKGNRAHYYCANCKAYYTDAALSNSIDPESLSFAALGHSLVDGSCVRCGYNSGTSLWTFREGTDEAGWSWTATNAQSGCSVASGVLQSVSNGGDHYITTPSGVGLMGHSVQSGDIIEVRYRTSNLPTSMSGKSGNFQLYYTTSSSADSFASDRILSSSVTRKNNQWQIARFTPASGITLNRLRFDVLESNTSFAGTKVEIDYVYAGPQALAPSAQSSLCFDFTNDYAASLRYASEIYQDRNFDADFWTTQQVSTTEFENDRAVLTVQSGNVSFGTSSSYPLNYQAKKDDVVRVRFRTVNVQASSNAALSLRYTTTAGATKTVAIANLTQQMLGGEYVTVTAALDDSASTISGIAVNFTNVSGTNAKIIIDYIFLGADEAMPNKLNHTHDFDNGVCTICSFEHSHDLTGAYVKTVTAATCSASGMAIAKCADCGKSVTATVPRLAHSLSNGVCSTCGYVHRSTLLHFAANTPSASYTWNTYDGTTTVTTSGTGTLATKLDSDASDHYITLNEEVDHYVQSGDIIEIRFKCDKARTSGTRFELRYTTATGVTSFSSNATTLYKSSSTFSANTWTTIQFTPTTGQTIYRLFLEPFYSDDSSYRSKTFTIDYIYIGPAAGSPTKAASKAGLYFDFTNETQSQQRFLSAAYGYMQTIESDIDHWKGNAARNTQTFHLGDLRVDVQSQGDPYVQLANASGSTTYSSFPLSYKLDGTDYVQVSVKFENCTNLSKDKTPNICFSYFTDQTIAHENPSEQTVYNYGAMAPIHSDYLVDGQYHIYTIPLSSSLTVGETLKTFRLGFDNVASTAEKGGTICIDYIAVGKLNTLPVPNAYTVTFCNASGEVLQKQTVTKGETAVYLGDVAKAADADNHYVFLGWNKELSGINADTTVTAQFMAEKHVLVDNIKVEADCSQSGYTSARCAVCDYKVTTNYEQGAHAEALVDARPATCTENGYTGDVVCALCGEMLMVGAEIVAEGHSYDTGVVTLAPTCEAAGVKTFTCTACGDSYTQEIAKLAHTAVTDAAVAPSCTQTGLSEGSHCSVCNQILIAQQTIAALGHTEVIDPALAPTCTELGATEGKHCSVCNEVLLAQQTIAALGHRYETTVIAPSCTESGITNYKCSVCGDAYSDGETAALGHSYDDGLITKEATCTTDGEKTFTCTACGVFYTETITAGDHQMIFHMAKEASCTEDGCRPYYECKLCGETFLDAAGEYEIPLKYLIIPATSHDMTAYEAVAATCTADGCRAYYECANCDATFLDAEGVYQMPMEYLIIAATGHSYVLTNNGSNHTTSCENCDYSLTDVHSYVDGTCSCGAGETFEPKYILDEKLVFNMNISAGADMKVVYTIYQKDVKSYTDFYLVVNKAVAGGQSVTTTYGFAEDMESFTTITIPSTGAAYMHRATFAGVYAREMGDVFEATLYAVGADGNIYYSKTNANSMKTYLTSKIDDEESIDSLKTMAVDMLNYGAAAQIHFGYDTENLVNADLTDEQKVYATTVIPEAVNSSASNGTGVALRTSVSVKDKVYLNLTATYTAADPSALRVVICDKDGKLLAELPVTVKNNVLCQASYGEVGAKQMRQLLTATLYEGNKAVSTTITWSVESYVAATRANATASATQIAMVNALLIYGDSVAAYIAESNQ